MVGDAADDWQTQPNLYNVIAITASMPRYNKRYEKKLAVGGRLFVVVGKKNSIQPMQAMLVTRISSSQFSRVSLLEMPLKPLIMQEKEELDFVF
jgi:protein-L-isoaspartate(D-aspartate) O-methyltransferase